MSYLYVASPYTHDLPEMRQWRYEAVRDFTAFLTRQRTWSFCPIMHSHDMTLHHQFPHTFEFWHDWNMSMIYPSQGIVVFQIEGWNTSRGVKAEISYAQEIGRPIIYSKITWPGYVHPDNPVF